MNTIIRPEHPGDYTAIDEVNRLAFGQDNEARLVAAIRQTPGFQPALSLVSVVDGNVVGHILFSPIVIESDQRKTPALALAPMVVLPSWQRQGVGTELVREGLEACRRLGHKIVVVVGHPDYYPRFGFVPAVAYGLRAPFPVPDEAFMILNLGPPGAVEDIAGVVRYPPVFNEAE